ncbi:hypothetical protein K5M33_09985 [Chromobacterium vaccinii]|nr:hypothetical protein [Chromobacterium vaccinii]MBX9357049.1 hypothetical protein [Chromobacterium vaccinii]
MYALWIDQDQRFAFSESDRNGIEISESQHLKLIEGQLLGKWIGRDSDGRPALFDPPPPSAEELKRTQLQLLQNACEVEIMAGFISNALGSAHFYGSKITDQNNLLSALGAAYGQPDEWTSSLWCANANEKWDRISHTAKQIRQLNADWVEFRSRIQEKYADLAKKA